NRNFDARVLGAEVEGSWEPLPGLRFNFAGGWEDTKMAKGSKSVDLMDRTGGNEDWMVVKPFATQSSNCIIPKYVIEALLRQEVQLSNLSGTNKVFACAHAYNQGFDPVTQLPYSLTMPAKNAAGYTIPAGYKGFDPSTAPNNGEGFYKDLSGNELPNAPKFTTSIGAQYSMPVTEDWAATLRGDFYWQDASWARVFNDDPYDRIRGYSTVNLSLILTSQSGWQAMGFMKNVFNKTAITGTFLNSDDSGLTTNVFLTDPRLIGVRITKNW
ncbi:MAG TPA: TonB-dependent receptor, partial [Rhizomicrobium sp.]|nr:TonB-dependent receptor [Rhizomicrobium sp.]